MDETPLPRSAAELQLWADLYSVRGIINPFLNGADNGVHLDLPPICEPEGRYEGVI